MHDLCMHTIETSERARERNFVLKANLPMSPVYFRTSACLTSSLDVLLLLCKYKILLLTASHRHWQRERKIFTLQLLVINNKEEISVVWQQ
jgi:hypothetical protein